MNKLIKNWYLIVILSIIGCFLSVWFFAGKYPFYLINLGDEPSKIADTINGLSSPVLTIITIVLVFLTFADQKDFIKSQSEFMQEQSEFMKEQKSQIDKQDLEREADRLKSEIKDLVRIMDDFISFYPIFNNGEMTYTELRGSDAMYNYLEKIKDFSVYKKQNEYLHFKYFLSKLVIVAKHLEIMNPSVEKTTTQIDLTITLKSKFSFIKDLINNYNDFKKDNPETDFPLQKVIETLLESEIILKILKAWNNEEGRGIS